MAALAFYGGTTMGGRQHDRAIHEPNRRTASPGSNGRHYSRVENMPSWAEVSPEELGNFVSRVVDCGACCIFSRSADGGVLSLTVIYGGERWRGYPRTEEDALALFREIADTLIP